MSNGQKTTVSMDVNLRCPDCAEVMVRDLVKQQQRCENVRCTNLHNEYELPTYDLRAKT